VRRSTATPLPILWAVRQSKQHLYRHISLLALLLLLLQSPPAKDHSPPIASCWICSVVSRVSEEVKKLRRAGNQEKCLRGLLAGATYNNTSSNAPSSHTRAQVGTVNSDSPVSSFIKNRPLLSTTLEGRESEHQPDRVQQKIKTHTALQACSSVRKTLVHLSISVRPLPPCESRTIGNRRDPPSQWHNKTARSCGGICFISPPVDAPLTFYQQETGHNRRRSMRQDLFAERLHPRLLSNCTAFCFSIFQLRLTYECRDTSPQSSRTT
jgi:hypothetical protein